MSTFRFSKTAVDLQALRAEFEDPTAGGYAAFEGWVRNHNEGLAVTRLEYEAFELLATAEAERIIAEATERFGIVKAASVHRLGSLAIGDLAVWVGVSARHRAEAFAACRYIIDELKHRVPIWKKEHYVNGDSGWVNCERCAAVAHEHEHHGHDHAHTHAVEPRPDYSRQMALREVGVAGQAKLQAARVLVVGAGGLGVPVLSYLAGAGIGQLGIVDADTLDASNLHRQPAYSLGDVGKSKLELITARIHALNPSVKVQGHAERLSTANADQLIAAYDLIVECSDNFATKFAVNDAAVRAGKPVVFASVYQYEGQLQVYRPDRDNACLRCLWPRATRDGIVGNCQEAGVLGPVPAVLGSLQALEVLKLLLDLPGQLIDELVLLDLMYLQQQKLRTTRRADCVHGAALPLAPDAADLEVSASELSATLRADYVLLDVREPNEIATQPLTPPAQLQIPLGTLLNEHAGLNREQRYLVICARGSRSRAAAEHLREHGFEHAYSLRGGVLGLHR